MREVTEHQIHEQNLEHIAIPASKAYYVGTHRYHFQAGTPAEILGVKMVMAPDGKTPRPCYHIQYPDGRQDYAVMQDEDFVGKAGLGVLYQIISEEQMKAGQIPPVVN